MTWRQANLSLQLAVEEKIGFVLREKARLARAQEDAMAGALRGAAES